jgi:hypothetical protein
MDLGSWRTIRETTTRRLNAGYCKAADADGFLVSGKIANLPNAKMAEVRLRDGLPKFSPLGHLHGELLDGQPAVAARHLYIVGNRGSASCGGSRSSALGGGG